MTHRLAACVTVALAASTAYADEPIVDRAIDTQLVHPALSPTGAIAVDAPTAAEPYTLTMGAAWQFERQPLSYAIEGGATGPVIAQRQTLHLGASFAAGERTTLFLRGSGARMEAGDLELVAPAQAVALGDVALGVKGAWLERERLALGPAVTVWLPVGDAESWVSERSLRYAPTLLASYGGERAGVLANLGLLARVEVDSGADFVASPELCTGVAGYLQATPWLGGLVELGSRHGLVHFLQPGAENPAEIKGGLRLRAGSWGQVDLLGGTGLTQGYGTSDLRFLVSVMGHAPLRRERQPEPDLAVSAPVVAPPPPVEVPVPVVVPPPAPLRASIEHGRVLLQAPIAFEPGTASLLPDSEPLVRDLAELIHAYPQIELLVIEGHADDLGSAAADFELSLRRGRVVFERLVTQAVPPGRVSYRGMGSADPGAAAAPRGVDLVIARVRPLQEGEAPWSGDDVLLPWSGEAVAAVPPGDRKLGEDAHPVLDEQPVPDTLPGDVIPSGDSFRQALDDDYDPEPTPQEAL
jgi:outer membrane protein OmpA-like peptidoglycan-associated protein